RVGRPPRPAQPLCPLVRNPMNTTRTLVLHAVTPVHVGTGQGEDIIDLPVARDRVTQHPLLPGSGLTGALRAAAERSFGPAETRPAFGPPPSQAHDHASALRVSDARLLALPVPSDSGTFAWVTSPLVLARLVRDAGIAGPSSLPAPKEGEALHGAD